jgi:probable blue pigment (indigoidine) exporter
MSILPLTILFTGAIWLKERPTSGQLVGVFIALTGSILFFWPGLKPGEPFGIMIVAVGLVGFTTFGILGREIARNKLVDTLSLTALPLGFGGGVLLIVALVLEGLPASHPIAWAIVLWLALVNTAVGYALYNHSLQILTALEMNMFLNLAPLATALLAWLLLDETLVAIQITGIIAVISGVILVQLTSNSSKRKQ